MNEAPLAYFITFTCYGAWLHDDTRGSVDRSHNQFGMPFVETDAIRVQAMRDKMKYPPLFFSEKQRAIVSATIAAVCAFRHWTIYECNVGTNHLHVVVGGNAEPDKMIRDFKEYATRRLREAKELDPDRYVWTEGASTRYRWAEESFNAAIEYGRNQ